MVLPTTKSQIENTLEKQTILIYGRPKVGKSTFCSKFENALFLATEPGLNHLEVFQQPIRSWEDFLDACSKIAEGDHNFSNIIIDTIDALIPLLHDWQCRQKDIEDIGDYKKFGAYHLATSELQRVLTKLASLPYGLVLVSHAKQKEVETKTRKYNRFTIDIGGKNQGVVLNLMDIILFMDSEMQGEDEIGVMRCKPSLFWEAGDKSKLLDETIEYPLDKPEVAFNVIKSKFKAGEK